MKIMSVILIAICFISSSILNAQTNKGRVLMGVSSAISMSGAGTNILSLGHSTLKHKNDTAGFSESDPGESTSINFLPKFGYFIFKDFAIGADLCFGYNKQNDGNAEWSQTILGAGPFIRYYFPTQKIRPFIEGNAVFGTETYKFKTSLGTFSDIKSSITYFGGGIGLAAPIGEKATFDIMASYNSLTTKNKENNPYNDRMVSGTFSIKFGFIIFLGS